MNPTPEQEHIVSFIKSTGDNLLIRALAGTGKTSTLQLVEAASKDKPVLCLAFNKRIAEEMAKRFPSTTTVRTFNSLGHRIWSKTVSKVVVNPKKTQELLKTEMDDHKGDDRKALSEAYWDIIGAVNLAKGLGYIPDGIFPHATRLITREAFHASLESRISPFVAETIDSVLLSSIKAAYKGAIDYNDQIYMPALFGGTFPRFPLVMVDEAQDLSPTNHKMLDNLVRGRIVAVGDDFQSIYAFRGAKVGGMDNIAERFKAKEADLTVSFRCPEEIVKAVHWRVPKFRWLNKGGIVGELRNPTLAGFSDASAVICRNNAPLFRLAFQLLGARRSVSVAGSEIGPKIIRMMGKIGAAGDSQADLLFKIEAWRQEKLETSQAPASIHDMADCMKIFAGFGQTMDTAIAYAKHLFEQQGTIKLLTGHKAKGLEWDTVYHLDPWLIKDGNDEQELNLRYVISTRARQALYEINSRDIQ